MLGRTFPLMLVDGRVYCSYSCCVMRKGRRHHVISRSLSGILVLSCLLKCNIPADLVANPCLGRCVGCGQSSPALLHGSPTTAPVALMGRGCLEVLQLISLPFCLGII